MNDGIYYLHPEGSAWIGVIIRDDEIVDQWYEADAATHAAANDSYAGLVPQDTDTDEIPADDAVEIIRAAMGEDVNVEMVAVTRPVPVYALEMSDGGGGSETVTIGTERPDADDCDERTEEWIKDGDWGQDGARVSAGWTLYEDGEEIDEGGVSVQIDPDHESLIIAACGGRWDARQERSCGDDPDDHDWTSEGEGGCDENPGVWATGGTSMSFASHCRTCGLHRSTHTTGSQRNPDEHDTVEYEMPETWCAECEREECRYPVRKALVLFSECDDEPAGEWISGHDTEDEAREAAAEIAHERGTRGVFVARDDVNDDYSAGGEYVVYID